MAAFTILLAGWLQGCLHASGEDACPPGPGAEACLGLGVSHEQADGEVQEGMSGAPLALCSVEPLTGYYRDGHCTTGSEDRGVHVVCASLTSAFLDYTQQQGNDLTTARPQLGFPGLRPGDRWCLCAARWEQAREAGVAPPVLLEATHPAALRHTSREALQAHAHPAP